MEGRFICDHPLKWLVDHAGDSAYEVATKVSGSFRKPPNQARGSLASLELLFGGKSLIQRKFVKVLGQARAGKF